MGCGDPARPDPLQPTAHLRVDLHDPASSDAAVARWEALTSRGGEGMVAKPVEFVRHAGRDLAQRGLKCRGREYLRIIYGPEYTEPENLQRLRRRGLARKRSLALREFALGIGPPSASSGASRCRVHECVSGVRALESEPIDPRP